MPPAIPIETTSSHQIVDTENMRLWERDAYEHGLTESILMENAGRAVAITAMEYASTHGFSRFTVICGSGNNGGDGYVSARYLLLAGLAVVVQTLPGQVPRSDISKAARTAYESLGGVIQEGIRPESDSVVIDGLLGVGLSGNPKDVLLQVFDEVNKSGSHVIAIDVPSGVEADTGKIAISAIRASVTVTFGAAKWCHFLPPAADHAGKIVVDTIGWKHKLHTSSGVGRLMTREWAAGIVPRRERETHKYHQGAVLIVGGSSGMVGAPILSARAAYRSGCGIVFIAVPGDVRSEAAGMMPEALVIGITPPGTGWSLEAIQSLEPHLKRCGAVCIGPGLGRSPETESFLTALLARIESPLVVDADALRLWTKPPIGSPQNLIITPHAGEAAAMLGVSAHEIESQRLWAVRTLASKYSAVAVLKGARTLIADGRRSQEVVTISVNTTGDPAMATAGSGDTLTGIIGGLLAQGVETMDAARLGVWLHGMAGERVVKRLGGAGILASEMGDELPAVMSDLQNAD